MKYHKIQTVFMRDPETNHKTLLEGEFSIPEFQYLQYNQWEFTEKVDGTNIRVIWDGNQITFRGKTDADVIPEPLENVLKDQFLPLTDIFAHHFKEAHTILYGEGYGRYIQKGGGKYSDTQNFVLFDVNIAGWWLKRPDVMDIANKLNIARVPVIGHGTLHDMVKVVRDGFTSQWGDFIAEGIVARPVVELATRAGNRIVTKLKYKDFPKSQEE